MGRLLQEVRGGGQGQAISKSEVAAAADGILGPLMDLLDGELAGCFTLIGPGLLRQRSDWMNLHVHKDTAQGTQSPLPGAFLVFR